MALWARRIGQIDNTMHRESLQVLLVKVRRERMCIRVVDRSEGYHDSTCRKKMWKRVKEMGLCEIVCLGLMPRPGLRKAAPA